MNIVDFSKFKTLRSLSLGLKQFENNNFCLINVDNFYTLFSIKNRIKYDDVLFLIKLIYDKSLNSSYLKKYISDCDGIFNFDIFINFFNYQSNNPIEKKIASKSLYFYKMKYGEDIGILKYKKNLELFHMKSPYKVKRWMDLGYSELQAIEKIKEYKSKKATSKEGFIQRHGAEKGEYLFKKFLETSLQTEDGFIKRYGEEIGKSKFKEMCDKKSQNSVFKKEYWMSKGFNIDESEKLRKDFYDKNLATNKVDYWISKGYSQEDAIERVRKIHNSHDVKFNCASKESLKIFNKIIKFLCDKNVDYNIGLDGKYEFSLYCKLNKKLYFYDFHIPSLNIIIEYHGEKFHPNPNKLNEYEWKKWFTQTKLDKIDADTAYRKDLYKKHLAEKNGFEYITVWSSENKSDKIKELIEYLTEKINENKENI